MNKHCEKRRNCLLQAISPFLTIFAMAYKSSVRQNAALCGNGLLPFFQRKSFVLVEDIVLCI